MNILVTGGAGYIGSHAVKRLLADGHTVTVVDNLSRGHSEAIRALLSVADGRLAFEEADIVDEQAMKRIMSERAVETVMHFAALAYVGESVDEPLRYFYNNTTGALALLRACEALNVEPLHLLLHLRHLRRTAREPDTHRRDLPADRPSTRTAGPSSSSSACSATTPTPGARRGTRLRLRRTALLQRRRLGPDGLIGEDHDPETHLIPVVLQAALGKRDAITIFGTDYDTPDGTCVRDYVHVNDLIDAHVTVMNALTGRRRAHLQPGHRSRVLRPRDHRRRQARHGRGLPRQRGRAPPGDPPTLYADPSKIHTELGWSAKHTDVHEIIRHAWDWFKAHPDGYTGRDDEQQPRA